MPDAFTDAGASLHVAIPFCIALGLVIITALSALAWGKLADFDDLSGWSLATGMFGMLAAWMVVAWLIALVPYDIKYHRLWAVTGTVESVTNTLQDASGDLTSVPVVELAEHDFQVAVSDPRIHNLDGAEVRFICGVEWVYMGADRYNCSIAEVAR